PTPNGTATSEAPSEEFFTKVLSAHVEYLAVDVTVKIEENGTFVYFSEIIHPAYILQNASPYWLKVTQAYGEDTSATREGERRLANGKDGLHQLIVDIPYSDDAFKKGRRMESSREKSTRPFEPTIDAASAHEARMHMRERRRSRRDEVADKTRALRGRRK